MSERTINLYFSETASEEGNDKKTTTTSVSFEIDEDEYNLWKLHDFCKRFAAALGFAEKNIEDAFGETIPDY